MAKYTKIPTATFQTIQINAGVLLSAFDPASAAVVDANILGATTGGINFTATPSYTDYGEDIDNCPKNTKELKRLDDREIKMSGTFVTMSAALAKRLNAAADESSGKITPRRDLELTDFKDVWLVGDYSDKNGATNGGFIAVHMMSALSTGGFQIQTGDKAKGQFAFEFTAHYSMDAQDTVPFEIYVHSGTDSNGIVLDKTSAQIEVGETLQLNASVYPANSTVTWDSSDTDTATVSDGVVTGAAAGYTIVTASITVSTTTYTDACMVHVVPAST